MTTTMIALRRHRDVPRFAAVVAILFCLLCFSLSYSAEALIRKNANRNNRQSPSTPVSVFQSAKATYTLLKHMPSTSFQPQKQSNAQITVSVDPSQRFQSILGFGGAFTEAGAYVYSTMNEENKKKIMDAYFGPDGLHYSLCRTHIGSCDFTLGSYNEDNVTDDFTLKNFQIDRDREYLLPYILDAVKTSNSNSNSINAKLRVFGSPWSPPGWMKVNGHMDGSATPIGLLPDPQIHASWALYFSKWLTAYIEAGVPMWGITVQNEPEYAAPYEACVYTPEYERDFIKSYLGPQLAQDHPDIKIMIYDHNRDHIQIWAKTILSDPDAAKYVSGTAFHWYSPGNYSHLSESHAMFPDHFLLASEATNGPSVWLGVEGWVRAEYYAHDILSDLNNWAVGWVDWNMLLDMEGGPTHMQNWCDAPVIGDASTQTVHFTIMYYYLGHFTKFIPPGSQRIAVQINGTTSSTAQQHNDCSGADGDDCFAEKPYNLNDQVLVGSFVTYDSDNGSENTEANVVIILFNQSDEDITSVQIQDAHLPGQYLYVESPAHSIQTFIYPF